MSRSYFRGEDGLGMRGWEREAFIRRLDSMSRWRDLDGSFSPGKTDVPHRTTFVPATDF